MTYNIQWNVSQKTGTIVEGGVRSHDRYAVLILALGEAIHDLSSMGLDEEGPFTITLEVVEET